MPGTAASTDGLLLGHHVGADFPLYIQHLKDSSHGMKAPTSVMELAN